MKLLLLLLLLSMLPLSSMCQYLTLCALDHHFKVAPFLLLPFAPSLNPSQPASSRRYSASPFYAYRKHN
uniref:Putative secreted peptide n=1 Tax=Anopheles braziliensis TaxID=58242 RepID=A0A2M3ZTK5_9DIPT